MLVAAGDIYSNSKQLLSVTGALSVDKSALEGVGELVRGVTSSVANLTVEGRKIGALLDDPELQIELNASIKVGRSWSD